MQGAKHYRGWESGKLSLQRPKRPKLVKKCTRTLSAILSRLIFWRAGQTFGLCRKCWGIQIFRPLRSIRIWTMTILRKCTGVAIQGLNKPKLVFPLHHRKLETCAVLGRGMKAYLNVQHEREGLHNGQAQTC